MPNAARMKYETEAQRKFTETTFLNYCEDKILSTEDLLSQVFSVKNPTSGKPYAVNWA
jgi:hypothetical protein